MKFLSISSDLLINAELKKGGSIALICKSSVKITEETTQQQKQRNTGRNSETNSYKFIMACMYRSPKGNLKTFIFLN